MDYSFNGEIAAEYGVDEAVFIHNLYWWIRKNEANGRHFYDGKSWTYNSMQAFTDMFPFWTKKQVRRIIDKLRDCGVLIVGTFNDNRFDHTQWYALSDEIYERYSVPKRDASTSPNGHIRSAQKGTSYICTDSKPDNREGRFTPPTLQEVEAYCMSRHNSVNPQQFIDFYASKGWMVGKNKMKDWKAAIRTWETRDKKESNVDKGREVHYLP